MRDKLAERIAALPAGRRALFQALTGRPGRTTPQRDQDDLVPRDPAQPAMMSFAQRRLWFIDQLQPGSPAYNVPVATRIRGPLDVAALRDALQQIVDRHEVLRTVYAPSGTEAVPHPLPGFRLDLPVTDLADESEVQVFYAADAAGPFDLAAHAPVRARLGRLAVDDHVLVLNLHHIVTDGWSMRLLYTELERCYAARIERRDPRLPQLSLQYADFAAWQRRRVSGERLASLTAFWRGELAGAAPVDLPTDRPRPPVFGHRGDSRYLDIPTELVARLREFAPGEGATLYMTLLAGFAVTLQRWTGQDDVVVGTSVSGRDHLAVSDLIGFFVNTLPLRIRTGGDPTFRELVRGTRATTLQAYAHQELPFDLIVDAVGLPRDPSRPPLTSVMFLLDETADAAPALAGVRTEQLDFSSRATKYDLMVSVHDTGTSLRALVEYPTDLFDAATVDRLLGHFLTVLEGAVAAPDTPLSALPLLSAAERRAALYDWNATGAPFPTDACLHHLFEEHADRRPDAPAVICGGMGGWAVTYREIEERANRLAHHLVAAGVGPDRTVALCLRRGPDLVTAILAVLKAGGAYVPLDPDYPAERLAFLVREAVAPVLVSNADLVGRVPVAEDTTRILLDTDRARIAERPASRPVTAVTSRDLAYVIFTSGSTGTPKGIALEHRGVVNNLLDLNRSYGVRPGDAVLALSSPSFDMSVYEVLGMLGAGGTLVLPDPAAAKDPAHWAELMTRHGVTVWNSAPALLELLIDQLEYAAGPHLPQLKAAFLGGDWIPVTQPDRIRAFAPNLAFAALGGATEASIHSIEFPVSTVDPSWDRLPYGRPMANQRAYILDGRLRPVPVGVPGELHLAGTGLARGYLNRPELTAEKFVVAELEAGLTERLYRTGDLARYRADGVIELLGRTDFRIKLNGLRIEPGEVESALRERPGIRDAVVVARNDGGSDRLVGYVVPGSEEAVLDPAAERVALGQVLPPHAVPAEIVVLDRLPLSPNGKVDRRALPAPHEARAVAAPEASAAAPVEEQPPTRPTAVAVPVSPVAPTPGDDGLAERIAAQWAEVIGIPSAGVDDDFFGLGGDSFAAVRAARVLAEEQGRDIRVVEIFSHPTPRQLADRLRESMSARDTRPAAHRLLHRLTPQRGGEPAELTLVCFPHGGGDAIAYQPLAGALPPHLELWAVSPPGHDVLDPAPMVPVADFARTAAEEIARTVRGPFAVYGHCAGVVAALETVRNLEEMGCPPIALHLAAALPEEDPEFSLEMERRSTDEDLKAHLSAMDGFDGVLDERDLAAVMRMVRHDMTEAARFFARTPDGYQRPLATPLVCIIGDADEATAGYETGHLDWGRYASRIHLALIPGARHYFAKHLPERLAELLAQMHPTRRSASAGTNGGTS
ncbi:amino acid adenylation domain-containing protein [Streptomyces sp. NPDC001339]|uniref:non-ribosomal peptide synthetase n=1 Tax=Streptomyces sp. NPDC001339 TaxID=3364563 RepID=UPI0036BAC3D8